MSGGFTPTDEQDEATGLFGAGIDLAVKALAGTGKTTTLDLLARSTPRPGSYVAFNRSIVNEARHRFPMNVASSTVHSVAFRAIGHGFGHRLESERMKPWHLARELGVDHAIVVAFPGRTKVLQPGYLASLVMRGITTFCASDEDEPGPHHIPRIDAIDPELVGGKRSSKRNDEVRAELVPALERAWADLVDPAGKLPYKHDHYVKLWQLRDPIIPGEFVLFDEAQDASPVMVAAVEAQQARGAQVVYVGDDNQQIYEWRGAVNALDSVTVDEMTTLTDSFRFGESIAHVANLVLEQLPTTLRVRGRGGPSQLGILTAHAGDAGPDAILCRSNAGAVTTVLQLQKVGVKAHLMGGADDVLRFAQAAGQLQAGSTTSHPDLACFDTWKEVQEYVDADPQGGELKLLVDLIDEFGVQILCDALDGMIAENAADVVVSTAHKAKGREWDCVQLGADYQDPDDRGGGAAFSEWRLLYVALTRARRVLDFSRCEPLRSLVDDR